MSSARERRVTELTNWGHGQLAQRVANCSGDNLNDILAADACGARACPTCGRSLVERLHSNLVAELGTMRDRTLLLASVSVGDKSLPAAWHWTRNRPLKSFYHWLGDRARAVGVIWADPLAAEGAAIKVALVMPQATLDEAAFEFRWHHVTYGRGSLRVVSVAGMTAAVLAGKLAIPKRWCPRPGTVPVDVLGPMLAAMSNRCWMINWGRRAASRTVPTESVH
jgi:hypothetical protein